jgi:hypothetical protein
MRWLLAAALVLLLSTTGEPTMGYKTEVQADNSGQWYPNGLAFATEAEGYGKDLLLRWTAARETRVAPSDEPVNYRWIDGSGLQQVQL